MMCFDKKKKDFACFHGRIRVAGLLFAMSGLLFSAGCANDDHGAEGNGQQVGSSASSGGEARSFVKNWQEVNGLTAPEVSFDALNTQIVALDPESPASIFQRIQLSGVAMLKSLRGPGVTSDRFQKYYFMAVDFCPLLQAVFRSRTQTPFMGDDRLIAEQLFLGDDGCGSGVLRGVRVEGQHDRYIVDFELKEDFELRGFRGRYAAEVGKLKFVSYEDQKLDQVLALLKKIHSRRSYSEALKNAFAQNALGFDIAAAIEAVMDADRNEKDRKQAARVLGNYKVYYSEPFSGEHGLSFKPSKNSFRWGAFGGEFLIHAKAIARRSEDHGFRKAVLAIRPYYESRSESIELAIGEARILPEIQANGVWQKVVDSTLSSISGSIEDHFDSITKTGVGVMYGPKSQYAGLTPIEKEKYLERHKKFGVEVKEPVETSCIGYVQRQLRHGYHQAGLGERFSEIDRAIYENSGQGTYLVGELKKDGWKTIYWNPDKRHPTERVVSPSIGNDHHIWTWAMIRDGHPYMQNVLSYGKVFEGIVVDFMALDFRPTDPEKTDFNEVALRKLQELPFFVGVANGGYHVYMGSKGMIIESHSTRNPTDETNIELRPMNQFGMNKGEGYLSGVIAVPPGPWMDDLKGLVVE